jgi:hypothetical protein
LVEHLPEEQGVVGSNPTEWGQILTIVQIKLSELRRIVRHLFEADDKVVSINRNKARKITNYMDDSLYSDRPSEKLGFQWHPQEIQVDQVPPAVMATAERIFQTFSPPDPEAMGRELAGVEADDEDDGQAPKGARRVAGVKAIIRDLCTRENGDDDEPDPSDPWGAHYAKFETTNHVYSFGVHEFSPFHPSGNDFFIFEDGTYLFWSES